MNIRDLSDELSIPRATLRHNLEQLSQRELVTSTLDNEYRTTTLGEATITGLSAFREPVETAMKLDPFLSKIEPDEFDIPLSQFDDAEITTPTRTNPFAPSNRLKCVLENECLTRCFLPVLPFSFSMRGKETISLQGSDFATSSELLVNFAERDETTFKELTERNRVFETANSHTELLGLLQTDTRAFALVLDDNRKPDVLLEDDNEPFYDWVDTRLNAVFEDAQPIHEPRQITTR